MIRSDASKLNLSGKVESRVSKEILLPGALGCGDMAANEKMHFEVNRFAEMTHEVARYEVLQDEVVSRHP